MSRKSIYQEFINKELFPIGFPVLLNEYSDPSTRTSKSICTNMKIMDLIPVGFTLNFTDVLESATTFDQMSKVIKYEFEFYIKEYRSKLKAVGIIDDETVGNRVWLTDQTSGSAQINNSFTNNTLSQTINDGIANSPLGTLHKGARSAGMGNILPSGTGGASKLARLTANLVGEGRKLSLPKIWEDSTYTNSFSFTAKLSSPYGSLKAIQKFIGEPLLRITALMSSSSNDGSSYGLPPYLYVRAYGLTHMRLGIPESITITRSQDGRVNKYKQPLDIDINITLYPAIPGFAAITAGNKESGSYGLKEDIVLDDMIRKPDSWDTFGGLDETPANFLQNLTETAAGPSLITLGSILKSIMPSPQYLNNDEEGMFSIIAKSTSNTISKSSNNLNIESQISEIGLGDIMRSTKTDLKFL